MQWKLLVKLRNGYIHRLTFQMCVHC